VLRNPEPHVEFLRFGAYSLDFELRFMLADMGEGMNVRNNLRIAILKRFKEEGIEIPLPQSDVIFHRDHVPAPALEPSSTRADEQPVGDTGVTDSGAVRQLRSKAADGNRKG
jgi:small-conductance mechanosensitive channel